MRSWRENACNQNNYVCESTITRYVWHGDNLLWELRAPGADTVNLEYVTGAGERYGQVGYLHADDTTWGGRGYRTTAWHQAAEQFSTNLWFGSLVDGMRDASGQMYMRNRYYDPATGQFTQADPLGLAGGLNAYGFAAGDPVSYADPYGLNPCIFYPKACDVIAGAAIGAVLGATTQVLSNVANDRPLSEGVGRAALEGGAIGGAAGGVATVARSIRGAQLADDAGRAGASTAAARTLLREGDAVLGVVHEGKLIAQSSNVTLSHGEFVRRTVGSLPAGAEVVTIGKLEGAIHVLRSASIHGRAMPASKQAVDAAKAVFRERPHARTRYPSLVVPRGFQP